LARYSETLSDNPIVGPPEGLTLQDLVNAQQEIKQLITWVGSSAAVIGVYKGLYQLMKLWVQARNGRKLKIKVDIEVDATQMKEEDVLRIFELLEEKADRKKIREVLLSASKGEGRPKAQ
jgi:hypothetical protein